MKKSLWIVLLLVIACMLTLSACDKGNDPQTPNNDHVHAFGEWITTKKANCTEDGINERYCSCGEKQTQTMVALGHKQIIDAAVAATCTTDGKTEGKHCSRCAETLVAQQIVAAKGHTEVVDAAVAPTCTATGLTEGKHCSVCNEVLVAQTTVAAQGHTEAIDKAVAPTCTATGLTEGKHCSVCESILTQQQVLPAYGHDYHVVQPVVACISTPISYQCSTCKDTYQESIQKISADFEVRYWSYFDTNRYVQDVLVFNSITGGYGKYTITITYTNVTGEIFTYRFSNVDDLQEWFFLGDSSWAQYVFWDYSKSSADIVITDELGLSTTYSIVFPCLPTYNYLNDTNTYTSNVTLDIQVESNGHGFGEWKTIKKPTCTEQGEQERVCSCGGKEKQTIPLIAHTAGEWIIDREPTCIEDGSKHQVCFVCNATIKTETLTKFGHTDGQWITDKEANCIEYGSKHYTCSRCQSDIVSSIPLTNHHYKGTTCKDCGTQRIVYNFSWQESYGETYNGYRLITIVVGEEYQLKYSADVTQGLFYDLSNWVFYEPYVVDNPSVISIDENGKIRGLKTGIVGIKNTGYVINSSNDNFDRRIYIQVISEYTETEYNDTLETADVIKPGQTIKFYLSSTGDVDTFKFTAPSNYIKVICTYHGDYEGAASGQGRLPYVQILNSNGTLMNSGTNSHDSAGNVYERITYIDTSTGYIIFKFTAGYSGLFPSGYFTIEIVPA